MIYVYILFVLFMSFNAVECAQTQAPHIPLDVLFCSQTRKGAPSLSPNGEYIAYCAPKDGVMNIWLRGVKDGFAKAITHDTQRGIHGCSWLYDNKHLLFSRDAAGDENWQLHTLDIESGEIRNVTPFDKTQIRVFSISKKNPETILVTMNKRNPALHDIYSLDLVTGELVLVEENPGNVIEWLSGENQSVRARVHCNEDGRYALWVKQDAQWREIALWDHEDWIPDISRLSLSHLLSHFSEDGNTLYIRDARNLPTLSLVAIDLITLKQTVVAHDPTCDIAGAIFDLDKLQAVTYFKEKKEWHIVDEKFQEDFAVLQQCETGNMSILSRSLDDSLWIVIFDKDDGDATYWLYDQKGKKASLLFGWQEELNNYQLAPMEPICFDAQDGLSIHGYITYPLHVAPKNVPMVVMVHGGPWARDHWGLKLDVQWLVNRGYAVMQINFRGSTGYGKAFLNAGNREWGNAMHTDITDGVKWAIAQGIADPKKVAIYGGSYGGYEALIAATQNSDLFCCAIDCFGPSNLCTVLKTIPAYWSKPLWYLRVGNPYEEEEFLFSRSPISRLQDIKIPLLIVHGKNDVRVKQAESEQIVAALKDAQIPHEYLLFEDEGHGITRPKNKIIYYQKIESFLAQFLGAA